MDYNAAIKIDVKNGATASLADIDRALGRVISRGSQTGAANDNVASSLGRLGGAAKKAANDTGTLSTFFDELRSRAASATPAVGGLLNNLSGFAGKASIFAGIALAIGAVGAAAISAAAQTQSWMASLTTITKSSVKAQESYAALVQFAAKTPFDLGQSIDAFTKLRSLGLAATESRLTSFGNTASAMGKSLNQMIEAVADASTGEFERLKEFGIKSKTEGDKVAFTFQGVTTTVGKNSAEIVKYLEKIGNTTFAGAMAKQMDTLRGAFSNIQDNLQQMFSAIGSGALGDSVKEIAKSLANGISYITPFMSSIGDLFGGIISGVGSVLNGLTSLWAGFGGAKGADGLLTALTVSFNLLGQGAQVFGSVVGSVFTFFGGVVTGVGELIRSTFAAVLPDVSGWFDMSGRSWANSIVGVLRAVKYVATQMPVIFRIAVTDVIGMFRVLGNAIGQFLTGNFSAFNGITDKLAAKGASTVKAMGAVLTNAKGVFNDVKGADAAIGRLMGRSAIKPKLDEGFDGKSKNGSKDKKDADDAERKAKAENDFWKTLQGEVETAKLLPLAAEDHRKELELQKILGRDLIADEQKRIANLMAQAREAKVLTAALDDHNRKTLELAAAEEQLGLRRLGMTDEQLAIEKKVADFRIAAQRQGVDVGTQTFKAAEATLRADEQRAATIEKQNKALDEQRTKLAELARTGATYGKDALRDFGSVAQRRAVAQGEYDDRIKGLTAARDSTDPALRITADQFQAGTKRAGEELQDRFRQIGTDFSNRMLDAADLFSNIANRLGGVIGKVFGKAADVAKGLGNFTTDRDSIQNSFTKVFGSSEFTKGLGKAVGAGVAGAGIGESIAGLGKSLGIKTSKTGGQIGGAIGGAAFGPIGSVVGGVLGSVVGGLFSKSPKSSASITGLGSGGVSITGSSKLTKATGDLATGIQDGLAGIAKQLGGAVGAISGLSIGYNNGNIHVNAVGGKIGKKGSGDINFNDDAQGAIKYAIEQAISKGAITGLSEIVQKALSKLGSDAAIEFASSWNNALSELKELTDPVGAAVDAVNKPLDALRKTMEDIGATSTDLAKIEELRSKKLDQVMKEQTSGYRDLIEQLNGSAGGVTALNQLNDNMAKFKSMKDMIASGKSVNQDEFTALAGKILGNAGDLYGTSGSAYQSIVSDLRTTAGLALTNATSAVNAASNAAASAAAAQEKAIIDQTNAVTAQQGITNDLMRENNALLKQLIAAQNGSSGYYINAINGQTPYY